MVQVCMCIVVREEGDMYRYVCALLYVRREAWYRYVCMCIVVREEGDMVQVCTYVHCCT